MSVRDIILYAILSLIASAMWSAILSIPSAFVLKLLTRLIVRFKLYYSAAYKISFWSWFTVLLFICCIGALLKYELEKAKIPGFTHNQSHDVPSLLEIIILPGVPALLALPIVSIIYGIKIEHPDTGYPIGIIKGILVALAHAALVILLATVMLVCLTWHQWQHTS
jgi:hypothetical protein